MAAIHQTAGDLNAAGLMDGRTMRKFDAACLTPVRLLSATEIRARDTPPATSGVTLPTRPALQSRWPRR